MVSIQEKIRNLSMGIAVSSIMSTGTAQAQETHQQDRFPQAIEKTDEWQRIVMPDIDTKVGYESDEKAEEYMREYAKKNGDFFWIATRGKILTSQEQEHEIKEHILYCGHALKVRPSLATTIKPHVIANLKQQEDINITPTVNKKYIFLQKEDYLKASRFDASKQLALSCIALYKDQPEKVDKLLPNLSNYINQYSENIHINKDGTILPPKEVTDNVQKHILKNFNQIAPNFDKQMEARYNERDTNTITLKKMTPESFYLLDTGFMVNFNKPQIATEVQRIADIMNIEPDPITQTQQKTVDNPQESLVTLSGRIF